MVQPSCPALVIHPDDAFRRALVVALDQENFSVAFAADVKEAIAASERRKFRVIFVAVGDGGVAPGDLDDFRKLRDSIGCGVILLTGADSQTRALATWADETFSSRSIRRTSSSARSVTATVERASLSYRFRRPSLTTISYSFFVTG